MRVTRSFGHVRQRRAPDACHALLGCSDFRWRILDDIVHALVILERVNSSVALVKIQPRNIHISYLRKVMIQNAGIFAGIHARIAGYGLRMLWPGAPHRVAL